MAEDLEELSRSLSTVNSRYGQLVLDRMTTVEPISAPFFRSYRIYRVDHMGLHHPEQFYVAFAPGRPVHLLTDNAGAFTTLAADDGVAINAGEQAEHYAALFIEVTRSTAQLTYLVRSVDDIRFKPNLAPDEEPVKVQFLDRYRAMVQPPHATASGSGWTVVAWVVRQQALQRYTMQVGRQGAIEATIDAVAERLPLVYGR